MPCIGGHAVARDITGLGVLNPGIEWLSPIRPLLAAIVANNNGVVYFQLGVAHGHQGRPVGRARAVARRFSGLILVKHIQGHSFLIGQNLTLFAVASFRRRGWAKAVKA